MSSLRESSGRSAAIGAQLASTQTLIQSLLKEIRDNAVAQAELQTDLKGLRKNVTSLSSIIRGGDGQNSPLISEVALLKQSVDSLSRQVSEVENDLYGEIKDLRESFDRYKSEYHKDQREMVSKRAETETNLLKIKQDEKKDTRLDKRQRFATWATIIVALISLAGSTVALFLSR